ncbi:cardiolipin synthase [Bacillus marinisedimentorum]|uniref:cardiolipin synthase n=1 Tax=Bacillus marinisedimentorum TaxID=1821260 RepID=UPI0007DEA84F|nr:cardiolipin synthase [Bacillus marinisedimentorum]
MKIIVSALFFIILIGIWLFIDFKLGRRSHRKEKGPDPLPFRSGNAFLLSKGNMLFESLFQDIKDARDHIHILFYIVREDAVSQDFFQLLMEKAGEGVEVRLLLDRIGCWKMSRKTLKKLRESGVEIAASQRMQPPFLFYSLNRRNHRKIAIFDGKTGYLGGFNIGKEYLGFDPKLGRWRDFHLRLTQDGVQDLQSQFLEDWEKASGKKAGTAARYFPPLEKGPIKLQLVSTDGNLLEEAFCRLIDSAKNEIFIGTPYFIPGDQLFTSLLEAAGRGVRINIMVPLKADHPLVKEAAFPYFLPLIEAGCRIHQFYQGFYHTKVMVIDEEICDIGTANFDKRSLYLNQEMNCFIHDPAFISRVRAEIVADMERSDLLTIERLQSRSLLHRGKEMTASLISELL